MVSKITFAIQFNQVILALIFFYIDPFSKARVAGSPLQLVALIIIIKTLI